VTGPETLYPWLESAWQSLIAPLATARMPHALLLHGPEGLGKAGLASRFAQRLLCGGAMGMPCGTCPACHLFLAETHPDYQCVGPEEPGKAIKVEAIRKLIGDLSLKPQYGGYRVFVIDQAELMNLSSANALLKTLEEPAERTVILLVTHRPSRLPPTILSRCQKLAVRPPTMEDSTRWLAAEQPGCAAAVLLSAAGGSPLRALALAGSDVVERRQQAFAEFTAVLGQRADPVRVAERWLGQTHEECIDWMTSWVTDLIVMVMAPAAGRVRNRDFLPELGKLAGRLSARRLIDFRDELLKIRQALGGQANRQLVLEEALIRWSRLAQAA
jgi:DNA polymerase-3 subunit delta'